MSTWEQQVKEELEAIRKDLSGQGNGRLARIETSLDWIRKGLDKASEDAEEARNRQTALEKRLIEAITQNQAEQRQLFAAVDKLEKDMETRRSEIGDLQKAQIGMKRQDYATATAAGLVGLAPWIAAAFGIRMP